MKKLEEIPKNEVFKVPEGYFENLPGIIQARVAEKNKEIRPVFIYTLRFALPAIVLFALGIFWYARQDQTLTPESILASIQTEDLVAYLNEADLTTEELLENVSLSDQDALEIEGAVYELEWNDAKVDDILDEIDLNDF